MRAIRTDKHTLKHGVATAILNRHTKLLRFCNVRRSTHSSQNKIEKIRQAMAMHFDHMYIECLDTKPALSKELEAKHLKELVLLHLDLIQQQAEDLAAKDKIIKELQDENQTLRSRLDRIDRRISLNWQKNDDTLGDSIKDEYEAEACSANNNMPPGSPTVYCLHGSPRLSSSEILTHSQSPVLRSQKQDPLASAPQSSPSPNCTITRGRDVSPIGRILRNTSSPVLKSNIVKDEFVSCISNNKSFADLISPLRHSPRLDANNASNSSSIDSVRKDNDSPNSICSRGSNSTKCDPTQASNRSLHETDVPLSNSSPKHVIHNRKSYGKSSVKCSPRDRKTSGSELETSDSESRCRSVTSLASQAEHYFSQLLTVNNFSTCNNKRKRDICEDELDFKKTKRTTADGDVINKLSIFNSEKILDYDSDGPTNHSLRSRDKTREHNGGSTPSSIQNASTLDSPSKSCHGSPCKSEQEFLDHSNCKRFHSMSDSCSSDNSTKSQVTTEHEEEEDSEVTSLEYEQVFVNSAATAAARLREANVKVPGCSLRPVRSTEGVLSTDQPYYLPTEPPAELTEPSDLIGMHDFSATVPNRQVEIPRWRVCVLSSLYVMEGTENLEDEVFSKRHYKLEQDEKRRKRWDLQRLREQRQYEKLRERYEVRNSTSSSSTNASLGLDGELPPCSNPLCCTPHPTTAVAGSKTNTAGPAGSVCLMVSGSAAGVSGKISSGATTKGGGPAGGGSGGGELVSLWPDPDNALYLEIVDKVPVCAFGQPCAVTPGSEFSLPWLSEARGCENTARRRKR